jgi:hypothetical protein
MKRLLLTLLAALAACCAAGAANAQEARGDRCHVYVADALKARKALDEYKGTPDDEKGLKAMEAAVVVFPDFETVLGEEELTTKTYRFPRSRLYITASVFYTDESMGSHNSVDSMLLSVAVAPRKYESAFDAENNAMAELTDVHVDTVRVKKQLRVGGRLYFVGMECSRKPADYTH